MTLLKSGSFKINKSFSELKEVLQEQRSRIDTYIVSSIEPKENRAFSQTGCGPNWDGDLLTQCTCRPDLRSRMKPKDWEKGWIAGFTGSKFDAHYLVYLMKVERAFDSFKKIYVYYDDSLRKAKSMTDNTYGDLYIPKYDKINDEWDIDNYEAPEINHSHFKICSRKKDITKKYYNKHPSLLVGDKEYSFIWTKPCIQKKTKFNSSRSGKKFDDFQDFLNDLSQI